ncbi:MAG: glutamine--fructose-6-phosphate transaminase (isomerizing) [Planctomycetes bacterium]|nr:glutamine--fructose-6-phosphate transaminase (isomerizing) [Planctomycetota bacterium]
MCGIMGYAGNQSALPILLSGLQRLEYRGYDSAGVVLQTADGLACIKESGALGELRKLLDGHAPEGRCGLGHTRWATHGIPSRENAHPHLSCHGEVAVIHNGVIENYDSLKRELLGKGHRFVSQTDSEVLAHLLEDAYAGDPVAAVRAVLSRIKGYFAFGILFQAQPDTLIGVRFNNPLVVGLGEGANYLASDIPAILPYTRRVLFLEEREIVVVRPESVVVTDFAGAPRTRAPYQVTWDLAEASKEGFPHFMLKEIMEQPRAVRATFSGHVSPEGHNLSFADLALSAERLAGFTRVLLLACGTSWHAALTAKYGLEELAGLPTDVQIASEFRYGDTPVGASTLAIAISQSGETSDTLAALRMARERGGTVLAVTNIVGSSLAREADAVLYTRAGLEVGVAATKTYTTQLALLTLFALHLGRVRGTLPEDRLVQLLDQVRGVPDRMEQVLSQTAAAVGECAERYRTGYNFMFIGRRYNYPNAFEGALKLKEISYIHAEGYCAGEMKHGPLALVNNVPTVAIAVQGRTYDKMRSNIEVIHARGGVLILLVTEGDTSLDAFGRFVIPLPAVDEILSPLLTILPLQLLAYQVAVRNGKNVDQPRNLAKSVTVE